MINHTWVNLTYTPIEVEPQEDGTLNTYTSELAETLASEDSKLVCFFCGVRLTTDNYDAECEAEATPQNI